MQAKRKCLCKQRLDLSSRYILVKKRDALAIEKRQKRKGTVEGEREGKKREREREKII